jgi:hypothetical protein
MRYGVEAEIAVGHEVKNKAFRGQAFDLFYEIKYSNKIFHINKQI